MLSHRVPRTPPDVCGSGYAADSSSHRARSAGTRRLSRGSWKSARSTYSTFSPLLHGDSGARNNPESRYSSDTLRDSSGSSCRELPIKKLIFRSDYDYRVREAVPMVFLIRNASAFLPRRARCRTCMPLLSSASTLPVVPREV